MGSNLKRCTVCGGRGALRCDCWPGDCICGWDDEPCEECEGTGWTDPSYDYDEPEPEPEPEPPARTYTAAEAKALAQAAYRAALEAAAKVCDPTKPLPAERPRMEDDLHGRFAYEVTEMAMQDAAAIRALPVPADLLVRIRALAADPDAVAAIAEAGG